MTKMDYLISEMISTTTNPDINKIHLEDSKEDDYIFISYYTEEQLKSTYKISAYYKFKFYTDFQSYFNTALSILNTKQFKIISRREGNLLHTLLDQFDQSKIFYNIFKDAGQCDFINKNDHIIAYCEKEKCWKAYLVIGNNFSIRKNVLNVYKNTGSIAYNMKSGFYYKFTLSNDSNICINFLIFKDNTVVYSINTSFEPTLKNRLAVFQRGLNYINSI